MMTEADIFAAAVRICEEQAKKFEEDFLKRRRFGFQESMDMVVGAKVCARLLRQQELLARYPDL